MTRLSDNAALNYLNTKLNTGLPSFMVKKTVTFNATTGTIDTHDLFNVTGAVVCSVFGVCKTDLVGASATIEVGIDGVTNGLIANTTATDIDIKELWRSNTPIKILELNSTNFPLKVITDDIVYKIQTAAITAGAIDFYCLYSPLTDDGLVE